MSPLPPGAAEAKWQLIATTMLMGSWFFPVGLGTVFEIRV
jgi:hypothetical protein